MMILTLKQTLLPVSFFSNNKLLLQSLWQVTVLCLRLMLFSELNQLTGLQNWLDKLKVMGHAQKSPVTIFMNVVIVWYWLQHKLAVVLFLKVLHSIKSKCCPLHSYIETPHPCSKYYIHFTCLLLFSKHPGNVTYRRGWWCYPQSCSFISELYNTSKLPWNSWNTNHTRNSWRSWDKNNTGKYVIL